MNKLAIVSFFMLWVFVLPAQASVQRFAVVVGNNLGHGGDVPLQYSETDAEKVAAVLRDLGGFEPSDILLLRNENSETFRSSLITVNDRIRSALALPNRQALLFVYYSGHADAQALHLGRTGFELNELARLVRGSAATFRVLVLDACRSGALTRVKGGVIVPPFPLAQEPSLRGEGLAFLTATSANEDAQESDELGGSFFTHAFVSGLLGAADSDGDGVVVLEEAYRHAYAATLRSTSRTFHGTQHPTFHYDFRGQDALVLTRLDAAASSHATLSFPPQIGFLVLRSDAQGAVVGEIGASDVARRLVLHPGRYFVRGRGDDVLFEGTVDVNASQSQSVALDQLRRIEYARLVRKGGSNVTLVHGAEFGAMLRTRLPNADTPCTGVLGGYRLELDPISLFGRASFCTSRFENGVVEATTNEYGVSAAALHEWDLPVVSLGLGLGAGLTLSTQRFQTLGSAPRRVASSPVIFVAANATLPVASRFFVNLDVLAETHFLELQETSNSDLQRQTALALRAGLLLGLHF